MYKRNPHWKYKIKRFAYGCKSCFYEHLIQIPNHKIKILKKRQNTKINEYPNY